MSTDGEVANALVCKISIRGFNSRSVLQKSLRGRNGFVACCRRSLQSTTPDAVRCKGAASHPMRDRLMEEARLAATRDSALWTRFELSGHRRGDPRGPS